MFSCSVLDPVDLNQLFSKTLYGFYMLFSFGRRLQNGFPDGSFEILSVVTIAFVRSLSVISVVKKTIGKIG